MAFKLVAPLNSVNNRSLPKTAATATAVGQLFLFDAATGNVVSASATSTGQNVFWISNSAITAVQALTAVLGTEVRAGDTYQVDTVSNTTSNDNGKKMLIDATGLLLTNAVADNANGVFEQIAIVGAATDKKVLARKIND